MLKTKYYVTDWEFHLTIFENRANTVTHFSDTIIDLSNHSTNSFEQPGIVQ